jgi:proteasome lid subunit RPN8/RPN11
MAIRASKELLDQIKMHGEESYPHECCGFLLGTREGQVNVVKALFPARNEWPDADTVMAGARPSSSEKSESQGSKQESRRNRYLITPQQWIQADNYARENLQGIIGYYHSHPDHPAVPSGFDLDHSCWPSESYIIVSIKDGKADALNSFNKPDYDAFEQEEIIVE